MKKSAYQGIWQAFSFTGLCIIMCGAAIGFLISSGWLVFLADEGQRKTFLLPLLAILAIFYFIYKKHKHRSRILHFSLYFSMSLLLSAVAMLYIFIPWWLPNYKGGPLLP